jgi:hypothetical protein
MKKARIALTAIGLLAVVGGALAFKATREAANVFCPSPQPGVCTLVSYQQAPIAGQTGTLRPCGPNVLTYYTTTACNAGNRTAGRVYTTIL